MSKTDKREFREDAEGVSRLVAAPGDDRPAKDAVAPGPVRVEMAPQNYDDVKGEFSPDPAVDGEEGGG